MTRLGYASGIIGFGRANDYLALLLCSGNSRLTLYVTKSAVTGREGQALAMHTGPLTFRLYNYTMGDSSNG